MSIGGHRPSKLAAFTVARRLYAQRCRLQTKHLDRAKAGSNYF
jgi:hypothetical protein